MLDRTPYQQHVLDIAQEINLALLGGRGGGKTTVMIHDQLRFSETYGARARSLFVRRSYAGLRDVEHTTREIFGAAYGTEAKYNQANHIWTLPTGAYFELTQIDSLSDLQKVHGRSMGTVYIDEAGQYPSSEIMDRLRANLRAPKGVPTRMIIAANPGGVGQSYLAKRFILESKPWKPFRDEFGAWWMHCPSTLKDNPHLDQDAYRRGLEAACANDPELLKAWLEGSFTAQTGAYFGNCFDVNRNVVDRFEQMPHMRAVRWKHWLSLDHGTSAPSVCYLLAESPGAEWEGRYYPRGSIVAVDEYAVCRKDDLNRGLGWTAATTAEALAEWCAHWKVQAQGVADDACFAKTGHATSIAEEYSRKGVRFHPAQKSDRISGWQRMRRMLADAGKPDVPGLYLSRSCSYALQTLPYLARDEKRPEDLDSDGPDHGADALRYGLLREDRRAVVTPLRL